MPKLRLSVLLLLVPGIFACNSDNTESARLDRIATGYCECATPLYELDQEARAVKDSADLLAAVLEKMQSAYDKTNTCLVPVIQANGNLSLEKMGGFQAVLKQKCPELAENKELIRELLVGSRE